MEEPTLPYAVENSALVPSTRRSPCWLSLATDPSVYGRIATPLPGCAQRPTTRPMQNPIHQEREKRNAPYDPDEADPDGQSKPDPRTGKWKLRDAKTTIRARISSSNTASSASRSTRSTSLSAASRRL